MANGPNGLFQVHKVPQVKQQILELAAKAKIAGTYETLVNHLGWGVTTLTNNPPRGGGSNLPHQASGRNRLSGNSSSFGGTLRGFCGREDCIFAWCQEYAVK